MTTPSDPQKPHTHGVPDQSPAKGGTFTCSPPACPLSTPPPPLGRSGSPPADQDLFLSPSQLFPQVRLLQTLTHAAAIISTYLVHSSCPLLFLAGPLAAPLFPQFSDRTATRCTSVNTLKPPASVVCSFSVAQAKL